MKSLAKREACPDEEGHAFTHSRPEVRSRETGSFTGCALTLKQPTCHRITDSRVADVKESHITPPKHAYIRLPQRRTSTLNLSANTRKVNDPKVLLLCTKVRGYG